MLPLPLPLPWCDTPVQKVGTEVVNMPVWDTRTGGGYSTSWVVQRWTTVTFVVTVVVVSHDCWRWSCASVGAVVVVGEGVSVE